MAKKPQHRLHDDTLDAVLKKSKNNMVSWFLMASWCYYFEDHPILSDGRYDQLCKELDAAWGKVQHRHKYAIRRDDLSTGSAFCMNELEYPPMAVEAALHLAGIEGHCAHRYADHVKHMRQERGIIIGTGEKPADPPAEKKKIVLKFGGKK